MSGRNPQQSRGKPTIAELYNLDSDVSEQNDLSPKYPEIVERMTADLKSVIERGTSRVDQESSNDTIVGFDTIQMKRWGPSLE
ncbi:MAG: hypothetical protein QGH33_06030, partial [Pirellulaceae bacterium]|jgi:hypothetical protein|nr:hypothetical protein [Pirellulaceae bacterium]